MAEIIKLNTWQSIVARDKTRFLRLNCGRRCLSGNTPVWTDKGLKNISDIRINDKVWSLGEKGYQLNKVNKWYQFAVDYDPKPMISFEYDNEIYKSSYDHPYFYKGQYVPIYQLIWRDLEASQQSKLKLLCKQYGKTLDNELVRDQDRKSDEARPRSMRLSAHNDRLQNYKNSPTDSPSILTESGEQATGKPQGRDKNKQQSRKPRMGYTQGEYRSRNETQLNSQKPWGEKRIAQDNRGTGQDNNGISTIKQWLWFCYEICKNIGYKSKHNSGHKTWKNLDISASEDTYCIEVENNHNFFIGKHALLTHNSGKSTLAALKLIFFAGRNAGTTAYYVSPSYVQSKAIMFEMIKKYAPQGMFSKVTETPPAFYLVNGSKIELKGADSEPDALRGVRLDYLVCDEVSSFRNWDVVWDRVLRPTLVDSKGAAMFISTPKGHNFWFDFYMKQDPEFASYTFSSYDNDYLDRVEIEKTKKEMAEDDFRQEFMAEFVTVEGQVYKEWNLATQFKEVLYDPLLEVNVSFDFGVNDPTAIVWFQRQGGEFRIIDYYEKSDASIDHFVQVIRSKPYRTPSMFTGDAAGKARSLVTNTSPIDEYAKHDIFIRTLDGLHIPDQVRMTHKFMKSLFVSDKLHRVRDIILNYHYPKKKENIVNQSNEIPVHDDFSHGMRAIEYYFANIDSASFSNKTYRRYEKKKFNVA